MRVRTLSEHYHEWWGHRLCGLALLLCSGDCSPTAVVLVVVVLLVCSPRPCSGSAIRLLLALRPTVQTTGANICAKYSFSGA